MNKHTPGPWRLEWWEYKGRPEPVLTVRTDADAVAQVMGLWRDGADDSDERQANARLIAAAPDLIDQLEFARDCLTELAELVENGTFDAAEHWVEANGGVWESIRAAIAKARGA
jgi:hypothetical protein